MPAGFHYASNRRWLVPVVALQFTLGALLFAKLISCDVHKAAAQASIPARRKLVAALYPFMPNADAFYRHVEARFEETHPGVNLVIVLTPNYYDHRPGRGGIFEQTADVYELDNVLLPDFALDEKIQYVAAPPESIVRGYFEQAKTAAQGVGGRWLGWPHWLCANFLFTRPDTPQSLFRQIADITSSSSVPGAASGGLLLDLKGKSSLGEAYLDLLSASKGPAAALAATDAAHIDSTTVNRLRRLLDCEPPGFGRDQAYHDNSGFYARAFARNAGLAMVGYSEECAAMLEESRRWCLPGEHCLDCGTVQVSSWPPLADTTGIVWCDVLTLNSKVTGQRKQDAMDLLALLSERSTYLDALVPADYGSPRYLLPARRDLLQDQAVVQGAPLFTQFERVVSGYRVVQRKGLNTELRTIGQQLDENLLVTQH